MNAPSRSDFDIEPERYELFEADRDLRARPAASSSASPAAGSSSPCCSATEAPAPAAAAAAAAAGRRRSAPGCTSARTARSPSTPARWRSGRTSAPRSPRSSPRNCTCRSKPIRMVMADTAPGPVRRGHLRQPDDADDGRPAPPGRRRGPRGAHRPRRRARRRSIAARSTVADGKVVRPGRQAVVRVRRADEGPEADEGDRRRRPPTTPPSEWTVAGTSVPKVDGRDFVTGRTSTPPTSAGPACSSARSFGRRRSRRSSCPWTRRRPRPTPGVKVVRDGDFVGVVAPTEHDGGATRWLRSRPSGRPTPQVVRRRTCSST